MNLRVLWNRFTRTVYVMDLRADGLTQRLADIRRRAARYAVLHHTCGRVAAFS